MVPNRVNASERRGAKGETPIEGQIRMIKAYLNLEALGARTEGSIITNMNILCPKTKQGQKKKKMAAFSLFECMKRRVVKPQKKIALWSTTIHSSKEELYKKADNLKRMTKERVANGYQKGQ